MKARWVLLGGLFAAAALLVGLTLQGLRGSNAPVAPQSRNASGTSNPSSRSSGSGSGASAELADEIPPWQATPQNTTALPPGTVPAWQVNPPPPDPSTPPPPPPREPPNPALHRPSPDNPGGVDGDRPARKAPGVE